MAVLQLSAPYVCTSIVDSNAGVLGISSGAARSSDPIRIAVAGDSAGANLTAACTIKAITSGARPRRHDLPRA